MSVKPVVMVSSVFGGYQQHREAARKAIEAAGAEALLVNEDMPALTGSPRNSCLEAVRKADALVLLVAVRGGFVAPSGKTATEEEFEEAMISGKPVIALLEDGTRDDDAARLAAKASDYVDGLYRSTFATAADVGRETARSMARLMPTLKVPARNESEVTSVCLQRGVLRGEEPYVRCVVAPLHKGELFEPPRLRDDEFAHGLNAILHEPAVGLFSFGNATPHTTGVGHIEFVQISADSHRSERVAALRVTTVGPILIDARLGSLPGRERLHDFTGTFVVAEEELSGRIGQALRASEAVLRLFDPYLAYNEVLWNVALHDLGHRTIEKNPQPRNTFHPRSGKDPILAFEQARQVVRKALHDPGREVDRAVHALVARAAESDIRGLI